MSKYVSRDKKRKMMALHWQELLERKPGLKNKYRYFAEWYDGRLIAIEISTGKIRGQAPTSFGAAKERMGDKGVIQAKEIINWEDMVNLPADQR